MAEEKKKSGARTPWLGLWLCAVLGACSSQWCSVCICVRVCVPSAPSLIRKAGERGHGEERRGERRRKEEERAISAIAHSFSSSLRLCALRRERIPLLHCKPRMQAVAHQASVHGVARTKREKTREKGTVGDRPSVQRRAGCDQPASFPFSACRRCPLFFRKRGHWAERRSSSAVLRRQARTWGADGSKGRERGRRKWVGSVCRLLCSVLRLSSLSLFVLFLLFRCLAVVEWRHTSENAIDSVAPRAWMAAGWKAMRLKARGRGEIE